MKNKATKTITISRSFNFGIFRKERTYCSLGLNAFGFILGAQFNMQPVHTLPGNNFVGFYKSDGFTNYCVYFFKRFTVWANFPRGES